MEPHSHIPNAATGGILSGTFARVVGVWLVLAVPSALEAARMQLSTASARMEHETTVGNALARYQQDVLKALGRYETNLHRVHGNMGKRGDLEGVLSMQRAIDHFESRKTVVRDKAGTVVPDLQRAQEDYFKAVAKARARKSREVLSATRRYVGQVEEVQKRLVKLGRLDDAVALRKELLDVHFTPAVVDAHFVHATARGIYANRDPLRRAPALERHGGYAGTETAVLRSLRWLKKNQKPDGSWWGKQISYRAAVTALALLGYLAHGETPASEEFGPTVTRSLKWFLANQEASGLFRGRDSNDYALPICVYALSEAYALTGIPALGTAVEKAVGLIVEGQHEDGGWDYHCRQSTRTDTSYMSWCVQALHSAQQARVRPKWKELDHALENAVKGLRKNAMPGGGFGYTKPSQGPLTSAGVLSMQTLGHIDSLEVRLGLLVIDRDATCNWKEPWGTRPLYYWYHTTLATFNADRIRWNRWNSRCAPQLVAAQRVIKSAIPGPHGSTVDIGYWDSPSPGERYGIEYSTALCSLTLQTYYRNVPMSPQRRR